MKKRQPYALEDPAYTSLVVVFANIAALFFWLAVFKHPLNLIGTGITIIIPIGMTTIVSEDLSKKL